MTAIIVFLITALLLIVIYFLSFKEDRKERQSHAPHGKVEKFYQGIRDRRRAQRLEADLDVKYNLQKAPSRFMAKSKNISEVGIAVLIYEILPKDSLLEMEIRLPGTDEPLKVKGRITWCENRDGAERLSADGRRTFMAGIEFVENNERQRRQLLDYISKRLTPA